MGIKKYEFCADEMIIIREALADYLHHIKPGPDASENRKHNHAVCAALLIQFRDDIRLLKS